MNNIPGIHLLGRAEHVQTLSGQINANGQVVPMDFSLIKECQPMFEYRILMGPNYLINILVQKLIFNSNSKE